MHWEVLAQAEDAMLLVVAELVLLLELVLVLVLVLLGTELGVDDEVLDEVEELVLVLTELLVLVVTEPAQALPVMVGTSALAPLLVPWKPNSTDWPG